MTSRRDMIVTFACFLIVAFVGAPRLAAKPNIVLVLTDDQGWSTLSCYGNRHVSTPNLDRLAAEGIRFTEAYATPQCTPTRASLLTGQHTARNRMWHVIPWYGLPWAPVREPLFREQLPRGKFTLAQGLREAGYRTACFGKWHLTTGEDGSYVGLRAKAAHYYGFDEVSTPPLESKEIRSGDKAVDRLTDDAIAFMRRNRDRPFFCYLAHHTLHGPVVAPEKLVEKYLARGYPEQGVFNATYLAAIEHLDRAMGRLLASVDELGIREETVVIFLSDNGGVHTRYALPPPRLDEDHPPRLSIDQRQFDNAPLRAGKGSPYEGGLRVPLIVRWPGRISPGQVRDVPVHIVDVMPTLLDIAGHEINSEHHLDGESWLPLWSEEASFPLERPLFWYMPLYDLRWGATPCAVVRQGDFKLIEYFGDYFDTEGQYHLGSHAELYNLRTDLGERNNLAEAMPERTAELQERLTAWLNEMKAEIPNTNPWFTRDKAFQETREKPPHLAERRLEPARQSQ